MIHIPSSEFISYPRSKPVLKPTFSFQSTMKSDQVIDISNTRKLLRSTTTNNESTDLKLTPRKRALARKAISKTSTISLFSPPKSPQFIEDFSKSPQITIDNNVYIDSEEVEVEVEVEVEEKEEKEEKEKEEEKEEDPGAKTVLFQFQDARILQFEGSNTSDDSKSQGRLLGSGKFEIYQLHQKRVSYLQCGKSVVYPILPKLKILKISKNQFLLSLFNPERYWRIVLETSDEKEINKLESILKTICHFRNLYVSSSVDSYQKPSLTVIPKYDMKRTDSNINFDIKTTNSSTSISTAVACFTLDHSDTSTFVDDHKEDLVHQNCQLELQDKPFELVDSDTGSIDLIIDEFFETINNDTQYSTSSRKILFDGTISKSSSITDSSQLISFSESTSWMDPSDEEPDIMNSSYISTPTSNISLIRANKRYISLNLNPPKTQKTVKRMITDPKLFDLHKQRKKESVAMYNMLKNDTGEEEKKNPSLTGFLKSLF